MENELGKGNTFMLEHVETWVKLPKTSGLWEGIPNPEAFSRI